MAAFTKVLFEMGGNMGKGRTAYPTDMNTQGPGSMEKFRGKVLHVSPTGRFIQANSGAANLKVRVRLYLLMAVDMKALGLMAKSWVKASQLTRMGRFIRAASRTPSTTDKAYCNDPTGMCMMETGLMVSSRVLPRSPIRTAACSKALWPKANVRVRGG